jgi:hypothetical protein
MEYNNYKNCDAGNDIYGKYRLELAVFLRDNILNNIKNKWFIENGTLLGAWRNNKFIIADDDFDIGMLIDNKEDIPKIYNYIKNLLPKKYDCRIIYNYCNKIEVYEPKYGNYILQGSTYNKSDYHYVTIDLQFYLKNDNKYKQLYFIRPFDINFNQDILLPLKEITVENEIFPCPNKTEELLIINYGSLDPNAKYSKNTGLYHI